MMKRYRVQGDANIDRIGHDSSTQTVEIRFFSSPPEVLHFWNVPDEVFEEFYSAHDKSAFYQEHIKGQYNKRTAEDVDEGNEEDETVA